MWAELLPAAAQVDGIGSGSPSTFIAMLDSCARHAIAPITQIFRLSRANDALEKYTVALALDGSSAIQSLT
jgi:D-arabinose 1-dehydrogenase-like Zn-dependent alcohol dehydrogenase